MLVFTFESGGVKTPKSLGLMGPHDRPDTTGSSEQFPDFPGVPRVEDLSGYVEQLSNS